MRLKAFHIFTLFRAVVVDIFVYIAVFLVFSALFARNHEIARPAVQQTTKDFRIVLFVFAWTTTHSQNGLDVIKKFLANNRGVFALINLTSIAEMSIIKRIRQDSFFLVFL